MLTKSDYLRYLQCKKYLWLYKNRKDILDDLEPMNMDLIEQGYEVENLARKLFKEGIEIEENYFKAFEKTKELMNTADVIYQALALTKNLYAKADILVRNNQTNKWDIYEVKSATSIKDEYLYDIAFQRIAFLDAGFDIGKTYLVHINKEFRKKGDIDVKEFFKIEDLSSEIIDRESEVRADIPKAVEYVKLNQEPSVAIVKQCKDPYECPFKKYCWKDIPEYSIYNLQRITEKTINEFIAMGIRSIDEVPEDFELTDKQRNQIFAHKSKMPIIDKDSISAILSKLEFPLYFLDYESYSQAIPIYDGIKPYQQVCFQYSLHTLDRDGNLDHFEFLSASTNNPIPDLMSCLSKSIEDKGNIVVWNKSFEMTRNKEMGEHFLQYAGFLEDVNSRVFDLMDIFKDQHYVHPDFRGSYSIKKVLPALIPSLSYQELGIHDGGMASSGWYNMVFKVDSKEEKDKIRDDLLKYCKLDTLAMVEIYRKLKSL